MDAMKPIEGYSAMMRERAASSLDMSRLKELETLPLAERNSAVAREFEKMLLNLMMDAMRETVDEGGLIEKGPGAEMYREFLDREYVSLAVERIKTDVGIAIERYLNGNESRDGALETNVSRPEGGTKLSRKEADEENFTGDRKDIESR
jgi:hypothetical protein